MSIQYSERELSSFQIVVAVLKASMAIVLYHTHMKVILIFEICELLNKYLIYYTFLFLRFIS